MSKPVYTFKSSSLKDKYLNWRKAFFGIIVVGAISAFLTKNIPELKYLIVFCIAGMVLSLWMMNRTKKFDEEIKRLEWERQQHQISPPH